MTMVFVDIVSVSNFDKQASIPLVPYNVMWGSPLDGLLSYQATYLPTGIPGFWTFAGLEDNVDGSLSVEMSSGDNGNRWAKVKLSGSHGLISGGAVNRDGIGAVVSFRTSHGRSTMRPVMGGSSHASQDSLELVFGLGNARRGPDGWCCGRAVFATVFMGCGPASGCGSPRSRAATMRPGRISVSTRPASARLSPS